MSNPHMNPDLHCQNQASEPMAFDHDALGGELTARTSPATPKRSVQAPNSSPHAPRSAPPPCWMVDITALRM